MDSHGPRYLNVEQCVDMIVQEFGNDIRICMPLGLGKPVPLINALYERAKQDDGINLTIFTALSLEKPGWSNELERRFLEPFVRRVWGGVPDLQYMIDMRKGELPKNVRIHELFFKAGRAGAGKSRPGIARYPLLKFLLPMLMRSAISTRWTNCGDSRNPDACARGPARDSLV